MMGDVLENTIILDDMEEIYHSYPSWQYLNNKSIYVTGASGMIASYIIYFLIYLNEKVGISCNIYAGVRNRRKACDRFGIYVERKYFNLVEADACTKITLEKKFNYIIHAASLASPQFYGKIPADVMAPNVVGTYYLLEHAREYGCDSFVFFSSGSVYGTLEDAKSIEEKMYGKMDYLAPGNCYGESKRCGEALCMAYQRQHDINTKVVRIFHTYGPTMDVENDARVFAEFTRNVVHGEDIVMKSDGASSRGFCYLTDTVRAIFLVLLQGQGGTCYNVGNPEEYITIVKLAEIIAGLSTDKEIKVQIEKRDVNKDYQPSLEKRQIMNISRMNELGWIPKVSAEEGFGRCLQYFKTSSHKL